MKRIAKKLFSERRKFYYLILVPLVITLVLSILVVKDYVKFFR